MGVARTPHRYTSPPQGLAGPEVRIVLPDGTVIDIDGRRGSTERVPVRPGVTSNTSA